MAQLSSTLRIGLLDHVSGPARAIFGLMGRLRSAMSGPSAGTFGQGQSRQLVALQGKLIAATAAAYGLSRAMRGVVNPAGQFQTTMLDIAQKADMSDAAMEGLGGQIRKTAKDLGVASNDMAKGVDNLMGKGLDQARAMTAIGPITRLAEAYGGDINEASSAAYSVLDNLRLPALQLGKALDVMAQAGKEGAFEVRDMAKEFPALTAAASALEMSGVTGVGRLSAALQIARKGAGTSGEAATNVANLMQKIMSPETTKKFQKSGIDIRKEVKKTQASGGDLFEMIARLTSKATKGDLGKLGDFFQDAEVQKFLRPLIQNIGEYKRIRDAALKADGVVEKDFLRRQQTFASVSKRFGASLNDLAITAGNFALPGLTNALDGLNTILTNLDKGVSIFDRIKFAVDGFISGLKIDGVSSFTDALGKLRDFLFGNAATFDADLKGLSATFQAFRQAGENLRAFASSVGEFIASFERFAGLDAGTVTGTLGTLASYGAGLALTGLALVSVAKGLGAVARAALFLTGITALTGTIKALVNMGKVLGGGAAAGAAVAATKAAAGGAAKGAAAASGGVAASTGAVATETATKGAAGRGLAARLLGGLAPIARVVSSALTAPLLIGDLGEAIKGPTTADNFKNRFDLGFGGSASGVDAGDLERSRRAQRDIDQYPELRRANGFKEIRDRPPVSPPAGLAPSPEADTPPAAPGAQVRFPALDDFIRRLESIDAGGDSAAASAVKEVTISPGSIAALAQPTGTQDVRITNPPPAPNVSVSVTVNATTAASPGAIGAQVGQAVGAAAKQAIQSAYSDGAR